MERRQISRIHGRVAMAQVLFEVFTVTLSFGMLLQPSADTPAAQGVYTLQGSKFPRAKP